jgi:hypothetical protein
MNKTEAAYAAVLEGHRTAGTLREWHFERWRPRLVAAVYPTSLIGAYTAERRCFC